MTPSGIELAAFRLAAQYLNQLRYGVPRVYALWRRRRKRRRYKGKKLATREPVDTNRKPFNQGDCFSLLSKLNKRVLQKHTIVVQICSWLTLGLIFNNALSSRTKYNLCCDCYHETSAFLFVGIPELKPFSSPRSTLTLPPSRRIPKSNFKFALTNLW